MFGLKSYKVKQFHTFDRYVKYGVYERFLFFFWVEIAKFDDKETAYTLCNKLNEKLP